MVRPVIRQSLNDWTRCGARGAIDVSARETPLHHDVTMTLPDSYRWSDGSDGSSHLYLNYGCVAKVAADGTTIVKTWDKKEIQSKAASVAQAKRFVERWIKAKYSPRAGEHAHWRARYAPKRGTPKPAKADDSARFLREQTRPLNGGLSSRTIKVDKLLPDDFESIAYVGERLDAFAPHADTSRIRRRRSLVMPVVG